MIAAIRLAASSSVDSPSPGGQRRGCEIQVAPAAAPARMPVTIPPPGCLRIGLPAICIVYYPVVRPSMALVDVLVSLDESMGMAMRRFGLVADCDDSRHLYIFVVGFHYGFCHLAMVFGVVDKQQLLVLRR